MKVKLAKTAGFCMGVRRALEEVLRISSEHPGPISTHGPLIHNPQVLELLETKSINPLNEEEAPPPQSCVVIRAHGVPLATKDALERSGVTVVDATCPHVIRVQVILNRYTKKGYRGIIAGDSNHPEVIGLMGHSNGRGVVVGKPEDLKLLDPNEPAVLVAQTTHHEAAYEEIAAAARDYFRDIKVFNTICGATSMRQEEVRALAKEVECMVVVGGKTSGNTRRLARIASDAGIPTFHIESDDELDVKELSRWTTVGVTAGASTPNWVIKQVVQRLERIRGKDEPLAWNLMIRAVKFLLQSDLYVAMGAASLCYASISLQAIAGAVNIPVVLLISSLSLYCLHLTNRFLDKEAASYNDPDRNRFFLKHRKQFITIGIGLGVVALALSLMIGVLPFLFLLFITLMGILYSVRVLPIYGKTGLSLGRLKDIPGSKTLSVAAGWAGVTTILPALGAGSLFDGDMIAAFIFIAALVFMRSALIELMDVQGDLIVGSETTPILIGEKHTVTVVLALAIFLLVFMPLVYLTGFGSILFLWEGVGCLYSLACILAYQRQWIVPGERFEFLVDSIFVLAGIIAILWN